ncbi:MAG: flagellar basal body rod protein FlgB [Gammaproteobacteria bacterium]|nr:flagellar basal body rod protein FlgB [Gammaproteobacteria bacterium]
MLDLDKALGTLPHSAMLRSRRAELLAANLANADTPRYQARDLDFRAALAQALDGGQFDADAGLLRTDAHHLALGDADLGGVEILYRTPSQASLDQNSVDVQAERARFADNAMRYQATMRFLDSRFSGLIRAFRGD